MAPLQSLVSEKKASKPGSHQSSLNDRSDWPSQWVKGGHGSNLGPIKMMKIDISRSQRPCWSFERISEPMMVSLDCSTKMLQHRSIGLPAQTPGGQIQRYKTPHQTNYCIANATKEKKGTNSSVLVLKCFSTTGNWEWRKYHIEKYRVLYGEGQNLRRGRYYDYHLVTIWWSSHDRMMRTDVLEGVPRELLWFSWSKVLLDKYKL